MIQECTDCGVDTSSKYGICEYYMVHKEVWEYACFMRLDNPEFLCIGCLEDRIGRQLITADFTGRAPVNWNGIFPQSQRLQHRLGKQILLILPPKPKHDVKVPKVHLWQHLPNTGYNGNLGRYFCGPPYTDTNGVPYPHVTTDRYLVTCKACLRLSA